MKYQFLIQLQPPDGAHSQFHTVRGQNFVAFVETATGGLQGPPPATEQAGEGFTEVTGQQVMGIYFSFPPVCKTVEVEVHGVVAAQKKVGDSTNEMVCQIDI